MQRAVARVRASEDGFTLIEIMIVIVILGILAAITVFAVGGITDRGETNACKANLKTTEIAVEAYWAQNRTYPATLAELTVVPNRLLKTVPEGVVYDGAGNVSSPDCSL
jgi:prepilin-type N-terminal cleavage/methylation domain-containing protein